MALLHLCNLVNPMVTEFIAFPFCIGHMWGLLRQNPCSSTGNLGDPLAQRATHPGECISDTLSAALKIFHQPYMLLPPSHEPVCLGLLWPGRLTDVCLSHNLRHKISTGPHHYVTLYTDDLYWHFKEIEVGVTWWTTVIAEETLTRAKLCEPVAHQHGPLTTMMSETLPSTVLWDRKISL